MDTELYDTLKEKIGDAKFTVDGEEKDLLSVVADWEDGLTKVKRVNGELKTEKQGLQNARQELEQKVAEFEKSKAELERQLKEATMSDDDRKRLEKFKKGGYFDEEEVMRKENAFQDKLDQLQKKLDEVEKARRQEREERVNAAMSAAEEKMKSDVISELSKHDIPGDRAETLYYTMQHKGNVSVSQGDDGNIKRILVLSKDGREMDASLEQLCQHWADISPWAKNSSGKKGPGDDHQSGSANSFSNDGNYLKMLKG